MHIHILGICGTFMGGIAVIAREAGHRVTGCDVSVYPPMSTQLEDQGIDLIEGYSEDQLALKPDLWVVGNVVSRGNALMEAILDRGERYVSGPQWLADNILYGKWVLAVAGTHGKTTTSSILAWILEAAGRHPGFLIGGVPQNFGVSARHTESPLFVIEADEYDTAFFDKRSKFVHYRPTTAILNNLEYDHADIFADLASIETQFHHFVRTIPRKGLIVSNGRDAVLEQVLLRGCWTPVERFGVKHDWDSAADVEGQITVFRESKIRGRATWELSGEHNRMNALAAVAAANHAGVLPEHAIASLAGFESVRRRMEVRGASRDVTVYDDFAHHPTAIRATIEGLRARLRSESGNARVVAVLEPRSNTMKLGVMRNELPLSLAEADLIFCYTKGLAWDASSALMPLGAKASCHDDLEALVASICASARPGDHVVIMSNGSFGGIHEKLLNALGSR